jgi:hypothetical protein
VSSCPAVGPHRRYVTTSPTTPSPPWRGGRRRSTGCTSPFELREISSSAGVRIIGAMTGSDAARRSREGSSSGRGARSSCRTSGGYPTDGCSTRTRPPCSLRTDGTSTRSERFGSCRSTIPLLRWRPIGPGSTCGSTGVRPRHTLSSRPAAATNGTSRRCGAVTPVLSSATSAGDRRGPASNQRPKADEG